MMRGLGATAGALGAMILACAAQAQSWEALPPANSASSAAALRGDGGVALVARCSDGVFRLMFSAVPDEPAAHAHYRINGGDWERIHWAPAARDRLFFSQTSARMARKFAAGGDLELRFSPEESPEILYQLDLPAAAGALNDVLSDCGIPLSDPRDDLSMAENIDWDLRPSGTDMARFYPVRGRQGDGAILCVIMRSGRLSDCELTYETPPDMDFGAATLALSSRFRLTPEQASEFEGRLVTIPVSWRLGGSR